MGVMATCKDCIHDGVCHIQEMSTGLEMEEYLKEFGCEDFKNKADFVEVVRCGKCKHWSCHGKGRIVDEEIGMCYNNKFPFCCEDRPITLETAFCSYGERK